MQGQCLIPADIVINGPLMANVVQVSALILRPFLNDVQSRDLRG